MPSIKPRKCSYIGALTVPGHPEMPCFVFVSRHQDKAEQLRLIHGARALWDFLFSDGPSRNEVKQVLAGFEPLTV
jgi:hypothetical protein